MAPIPLPSRPSPSNARAAKAQRAASKTRGASPGAIKLAAIGTDLQRPRSLPGGFRPTRWRQDAVSRTVGLIGICPHPSAGPEPSAM